MKNNFSETFSPIQRKVLGVVNVVYNRISSEKQQTLLDLTNDMEKFQYIQQYCIGLMQRLDELPADTVKMCTEIVHREQERMKKEAKKASVKQTRLHMLSRQIEQYFTPATLYRRIRMNK